MILLKNHDCFFCVGQLQLMHTLFIHSSSRITLVCTWYIHVFTWFIPIRPVQCLYTAWFISVHPTRCPSPGSPVSFPRLGLRRTMLFVLSPYDLACNRPYQLSNFKSRLKLACRQSCYGTTGLAISSWYRHCSQRPIWNLALL